MNKNLIIGLGIFGAIGLACLVVFASGVSIYNTQSRLKNTYEMKIKSNEADFDNLWKKIAQATQVADAKKDGFRQIFNEYATARTAEGQGRVMAWVKENAPNVNLDIYDNLMNIMAGSRDGWTMRQRELVDIAREYNQNLVTFPKNFVLGLLGFQKIDPKVITSSRTEQVFSTGKDDNVELYKK